MLSNFIKILNYLLLSIVSYIIYSSENIENEIYWAKNEDED